MPGLKLPVFHLKLERYFAVAVMQLQLFLFPVLWPSLRIT